MQEPSPRVWIVSPQPVRGLSKSGVNSAPPAAETPDQPERRPHDLRHPPGRSIPVLVIPTDPVPPMLIRIPRSGAAAKLAAAGAALLCLAAAVLLAEARAEPLPPPPYRLAPVRAVGIRVDTLLLGGYAGGTFTEAMRLLASDLSDGERALVGQHLDRVFGGVVERGGLGRSGRLRVAYERSIRPDGSTRAIRVLAAEAAVAGEMHTAFYFERGGRPGFFDPFGRSLDPHAWTGPLPETRVTSPFGLRRTHPILRRVLPHTGVDYAASAGAPVRATGDGIVVFAGPRGGYGNLVEIQHPSGYSTRYAHLSRIASSVALSRAVRQGEVIGAVGMTGLATAPHLHYEVRRRGSPVDPQRVARDAGISADVGAEPRWPAERRLLSGLLARTPALARNPARP